MAIEVRLYRIRVVLKLTRFTELHAFHYPIVYALLAEANGKGHKERAAIPDGLLLEAPEQCRVAIRRGERYAFGFQLLAGSQQEACSRIFALIRGLYEVGASAPRTAKLGGNFEVELVQDLVSGQALYEGAQPQCLSTQRMLEDVAQLHGSQEVTVRFHTPLRMKRPANHRQTGHQFFDGQYFGADLFVGRVLNRQRRIGFGSPTALDESLHLPDDCVALVDNRLAWLDVSYGPKNDRTSLGGCFGKVRLKINDPRALAVLVWGSLLDVDRTPTLGLANTESCLPSQMIAPATEVSLWWTWPLSHR